MAELLRDSEKSPILPPEAGFLHPSMGGSWAPLRVLWRTELHALLPVLAALVAARGAAGEALGSRRGHNAPLCFSVRREADWSMDADGCTPPPPLRENAPRRAYSEKSRDGNL